MIAEMPDRVSEVVIFPPGNHVDHRKGKQHKGAQDCEEEDPASRRQAPELKHGCEKRDQVHGEACPCCHIEELPDNSVPAFSLNICLKRLNLVPV